MSSETDKDIFYNSISKTTTPSDDRPRAMSSEEPDVAETAARNGYGSMVSENKQQLIASANSFHPGMFQAPAPRQFANPAPLGLCAFALTTFVLSLINMQARGAHAPNLVVASAFGYGGLVQLLAGMWYVFYFVFRWQASRYCIGSIDL